MPTLLALPRLRTGRAVRSLLPTLAVFGLLSAAACGGGGSDGGNGPTDPGSASGPATARVDVAAQFFVAATTTGLTLRVTPAYELAAGGRTPLAATTVAVATTAAQTIPVTLDVTACLANPARNGGDQGTGANAVCRIVVEYALLAGTRVVDAQSFGTYTVRGGTVTAQTVTFTEVTGVRVTMTDGTVLADGAAARAEVGRTLPLLATAVRPDGAAYAGRPVRWTSESPAVATVDSVTGVVTPVAPGQARIVAASAGQQSGVAVAVVPAPAAVTVAVAAGAGSGTVTSSPAGIACRVVAGRTSGPCSGTFAADAAVTLTAAPDAGSTFTTWGGDCASAAGATTCQVTPSVARSALVTFTALRTLGVALPGPGSGRVTSAPAGIDCAQNAAAGCSASFVDGAAVTLTAAPDATSQFAGWGGACAGTGVTCTVTLDQARSVTATFTLRRVTITLQAAGPGGGSLTAGGTGVANGVCTTTGPAVTCAATVDVGTAVVVSAAPDSVSTAGTWSGGPCTGPATTPCSLTVTSDVTVGTAFAQIPTTATPVPFGISVLSTNGTRFVLDLVFQRRLNGQQANSGQVTFALATDQPQPVLTLDADAGTTVKLTVRAQAGGRVVSWGGACAGSQVGGATQSCIFTQTPNAAISINIGPAQ